MMLNKIGTQNRSVLVILIIFIVSGHSALPQEILPKLEGYSKLILWFGNSEICWDAARQFAKKLSELRCFFVRYIQ